MNLILPIMMVFSSVLHAEELDDFWLKIMHYEGKRGSYENRVTNKDFFFTDIDSNEPIREYRRQFEFFSKKTFTDTDIKTICKFPMRSKYFSRKLKRPISLAKCKDFIEWKILLDFSHIKFVYASSFPNNPASMFGHTFIVLSKNNEKMNLDSIAISYMARAEQQDAGPIYMYKGLTGGYRGYYEISRFYDVLKLYQKQEDRNLWYFDLDVSKEQKENLISLLWEAKSSLYKPYLFFDKNCSYELLSLLYAADMIDDFRGEFGIFTMPLETYKKLAARLTKKTEEKVLISNLNNIERQIASMSKNKKRRLYASMGDPKEYLEDIDIVDMNIQIQHRKVIKNSLWMSKDFSTLSNLLVYRAGVKDVSNIDREYNVAAREQLSPLSSNSIHRILVGSHFSTSGGILELAYRSGVRDFLDQRFFYDNESSVEFFNTSIFIQPEDRKVKLNRFTFMDVTSIEPISRLSPMPSWSLGLNGQATNQYDFSCDNCYESNLYGGVGISTSFFPHSTAYIMTFASLKYKVTNNKWIYPSLRGGVRYNFDQSTLIALRFIYSYFMDEASNVRLDLNKNLAKNVAGTITAKYQIQNKNEYTDLTGSLKYYF